MRAALLLASAIAAAADYIAVSAGIDATCQSSLSQAVLHGECLMSGGRPAVFLPDGVMRAGGCAPSDTGGSSSIACVNSSFFNLNVYSGTTCTGPPLNSQGSRVPFPPSCSRTGGAWSQFTKGLCMPGTINTVPYPTSGGFVGLTTTGATCSGAILSGQLESCEL